jgi:lysophospholipase L1-like esterase
MMERNLYLALGDSVTAGHGATHRELAFVNQVSQFTTKTSSIKHTLVIAQNGWTTKDVLQAVHFIHQSAWENTRLLTLMTGGNDLRSLLRRLYFPMFKSPITAEAINRRLQQFRIHLHMLCDSISKHDIPTVLAATVYNPAPNFPLAVDAMKSLNAIIQDESKSHHFELIDVHKAFLQKEASYIDRYRTGRLEDLASPIQRPIHPNDAGHRQIAELITERLTQIQNVAKANRVTRRPKVSKTSRH